MSRVVTVLFHTSYAWSSERASRTAFAAYVSNTARFILLPALLSLLLSACATIGDLGRTRPTVFTKTTDEILLNADIVTRGLVRPELSRDEIVMRETGHRMAKPLDLDPSALNSDYGVPYDGYGGRYGASDPALPLAAMHRELDTDHHLLTQFGVVARRVLITDSQRMESVLKYDPVLRVKEREAARARMQENFNFIESVFEGFGKRLEDYHYAIEDVRALDPNLVVVEVHGSLDHLRDRAASLKYELTHTYGAFLARSESQFPRFASREHPSYDPGMPYGGYADAGRYPGRLPDTSLK